MAEVHIVDIDGEQWDIKDASLTARVAALEEVTSVKDLPDLTIDLEPGYTARENRAITHYSYGKVHFMSVRIGFITGVNIGTAKTAVIGFINVRPKKETGFLLYDFINSAVLRCFLRTDGGIALAETTGVVQGNNDIRGELIFAEP